MTYILSCDTCDFSCEITDEIDTYAVAKDHEEDFPDHFVYIEQQS